MHSSEKGGMHRVLWQRFLLCQSVWLALSVTAASADSAARTGPNVPRCTVVAAQMLDTLDSSKARVGDFFRFQTVNAVLHGKDVVFAAHTPGWGVVSVAVPAGRAGRAGLLVLEPLYLKLGDGRKVGVVLDHNSSDLRAAGSSDNLPGYLGAIPVPGAGAVVGVFDYFHHGKDITVNKGMIFAIFPSNDPSVASCRHSE